MPLVPRSYGLSDVGHVRKRNEDSFVIDDKLGLYAVADGMGGHAGGDVASAEAIDQVHAMMKRGLKTLATLSARPPEEAALVARRMMEAAIQAATYMVFGLAEQDPRRRGMGTTLSALLVAGGLAVVGQVGDSRVYLVRDGRAIQITEDHTLVNQRLKTGVITLEEARTASYANLITRAVGLREYVEVDTFALACRPGDRFVLCSDGVHGYLESEETLAALLRDDHIEVCVHALIGHALRSGGHDNATALLVEVVEGVA